jgi:hypothetical protein
MIFAVAAIGIILMTAAHLNCLAWAGDNPSWKITHPYFVGMQKAVADRPADLKEELKVLRAIEADLARIADDLRSIDRQDIRRTKTPRLLSQMRELSLVSPPRWRARLKPYRRSACRSEPVLHEAWR